MGRIEEVSDDHYIYVNNDTLADVSPITSYDFSV